ncbi:MAG: oxidoreductase [Chloroflexi bacterium HGW-Chloroflexi-10]|nr:MAG: oxidoreductase [Chloroflexi bacterium HGW-Chloroflexi-10]
MRTIRWGIIGCGNVTEVKSGPGFQQTIGSQLVAVMRRDGALAEDYAKRHGVPRWYTDAQQLIDDPEVDAVYIATPPNLHHPYTLAAARAGKPVYVEKPMALNMAECQEMIAVCQDAGVPLFVAYYRRALPRFVKAKELIENGTIGSVRHVQISLSQPPQSNVPSKLPWRFLPEIAGGGLFVDLASHTLDFLDFALGPIKSARGFARNQAGHYPAEDIVSAAFEFENGVLGTGIWSFNSFNATDQISLVGSTGKITLSTFEDKPLILETHSGSQSFDLPHPTHIQQPLIEQIVAELQGTGRCVSTGESAIRTTQVMDQLLDDYYRPSRSIKQTETTKNE